MSDAKLWIDEVGCTATIAGTNVSYTMPLWAFNVMRDIIGAEAEKKVEVTHRDFDTQQELLDRHKAENAKLRDLLLDYDKMLAIAADELAYKSRVLRMDSVLNALRIRLHKLGIEVDDAG